MGVSVQLACSGTGAGEATGHWSHSTGPMHPRRPGGPARPSATCGQESDQAGRTLMPQPQPDSDTSPRIALLPHARSTCHADFFDPNLQNSVSEPDPGRARNRPRPPAAGAWHHALTLDPPSPADPRSPRAPSCCPQAPASAPTSPRLPTALASTCSNSDPRHCPSWHRTTCIT